MKIIFVIFGSVFLIFYFFLYYLLFLQCMTIGNKSLVPNIQKKKKVNTGDLYKHMCGFFALTI